MSKRYCTCGHAADSDIPSSYEHDHEGCERENAIRDADIICWTLHEAQVSCDQ